MNRPEPIELENNLGPDAVTGEINRVQWMAYDVDEMDLYIAEKDAEIAELKKKLMPCLNGDCIYTCDVVEKHVKEELKAKRALWIARAMRAKAIKWHEGLERYLQERKKYWPSRFYFMKDDEMYHVWYKCWCDVERKCLKKAEEYK